VRLFVGVELNETVRRSAAAIAAAAAERLGRQVRARWIPPNNLHITLWFIGHVTEDRAQHILRAVDRPFATRAFELQVAKLGTFPPSGPPRVIWLGIDAGAESLNRLHGELAARFAPIGITPEPRPYSAHLTIARVSSSERGSSSSLRASIRAIPAAAGGCRVESVTVFQSHLSPKGATYEALLRVPLA
jgi:RNA 2',3'-cyclic 3'-phosphodiesterase